MSLFPSSVRAVAPGKINIYLQVGPVRQDGYHPLASLFCAVALEEELELEAVAGEIPVLTLGEESDSSLGLSSVPLDGSNLACRAVRAVWEAAGIEPRESSSARMQITKRVPIAGGMGGGSADAAAALIAANSLLPRPLGEDALLAVASSLGADVPFALKGGIAVGLGVGDQLEALETSSRIWWVVLPAQMGLSTPEVFRHFDQSSAGRAVAAAEQNGVESDPLPQVSDALEVPEALMEAVRCGDARALAPLLRNDLQEPALELAPELREGLEAGHRAGALRGIVSGSGPTLAFLCTDQSHAFSVQRRLKEGGYPRAQAVQGPTLGARVL